ncbi:Fc.00g031800.m01.CDS01 [Cosmosporella sp. VM-42]
MAYQPMPNQLTDSPFLDERISAYGVSKAVGPGFSEQAHHIAAPTQPTELKSLGGGGASQDPSQTVEGDKKPARRPRNRRQSQATSALSEISTSGLATESLKPRKRCRKPKKQVIERDTTGQLGELDEDDLPQDPRRRRVLERNRIAATKCRLRKRDEASTLASREQAIEDQNRYLSTCFDSLNAEIYHLKMQLLRHTDCNCVLIQKYISNEARKSVDGQLACSSAFEAYGGPLSPHYGGFSDTSITDWLNVQSPEVGSISPTWTNPFQQGPLASVVGDYMFDMSLELFQKAAMPSASIISAQTTPGVPLAGWGPGYTDTSIGPQQQPVDEMV